MRSVYKRCHMLGGHAGLRRGEMVALEWSDVDFKRGLLTVRRGEWVFFQRDGSAVDESTLRSWMERAQKQAGLAINKKGQIHILRHTFCSHLAMKNVPPRVIQDLAGHADLNKTMRYMHLAKGSKESAIAVLDQPQGSTQHRGDLLETQPTR